MATKLSPFTRGGTFSAVFFVRKDGIPASLKNISITSQGVNAQTGRKVCDFVVTVGAGETDTDQTTGRIVVTAQAADTAKWPLDGVNFDLRFQETDGLVWSTGLLTIPVLNGATKPTAPPPVADFPASTNQVVSTAVATPNGLNKYSVTLGSSINSIGASQKTTLEVASVLRGPTGFIDINAPSPVGVNYAEEVSAAFNA